MRRISILLTFLLFSFQFTFATVYYVSLSGNDSSGDGSSARPWRTLQTAVSRVPANQGHTIKILAGTFVENAYIKVPTGVNIEGSGIGTTILKAGPGLHFQSNSWYYDRFLITLADGGAGNQSIKNLTVDGSSKKLYGGILVKGRNNVLIQGVRVQYCYLTGIWIHTSTDSRVTEVQLKDNAWGGASGASGSMYLSACERIEVDHVTVDEAYGQALDAVMGKVHYLKLHDNHFSVNPVGNWQTPSGQVVPNIAVELYNVDLRGCEIYNNYFDNSLSIVMDYYEHPRTGHQTVHLYNNVFDLVTRANGSGYGVELMVHDAEVNNNYFWGGSTGVVNWEKAGRPPRNNWKIHHNVFYGLGSGYPTGVVNFYQNGINGAHIYNNTVETIGSATVSFIEVNHGGVANNLKVENNLIIDSNTSYQWYPNKFINLLSNSRVQNSIVRNNFLQKMPMNTVSGVTYSNNKSGDPQIERNSTRPSPYYKLKSGSSLIDAGINAGLSFVGLAPDIGAYESGETTSPSNARPQISITSPVSNANFPAGEAVTISASATDSDGSISKVEFYQGSTKLGEDKSSPYSISWKTVQAGNFSLTAVATDNSGAMTTSAPVAVKINGSVVIAVPGILQAESYAAMNGIQLENTTDTGGGQNVGWYETGDWLDYNVNVASAGKYTLEYRVASLSAGGSIELRSGATTLASTKIPVTGAWQEWTTVRETVSLKAGSQTLRLQAGSGAFNLNWVNFKEAITSNTPPVVSISSPSEESSFTAPATITLSANASDADGTISKVAFYSDAALLGTDSSRPYEYSWSNVPEGAYSITAVATDAEGKTTTSAPVTITVSSTPANPQIPGTVQAEDFTTMSGVELHTTDSEDLQKVARIQKGDWMDYQVNVLTAGNYAVEYRVTSLSEGGIIELISGTDVLATTVVPPTGAWEKWTSVFANVKLPAGLQTLRVHTTIGSINITWMEFVAPKPTGVAEIPGIIEAEAYEAINGIQFEETNDENGGKNAGWIDAGDWIDYKVDVETAGIYEIEYRVASQNGGGNIELRSETSTLASTPVASTGGWQSWTTITTTAYLNAGEQVLKVHASAGGFNMNWIKFNVLETEVPGAALIPGGVQAEDYSAMNGIQLQETTDTNGGQNVGWMDPGDWMDYTVNVSQAGTYLVQYRVAADYAGGWIQLKSGSSVLAATYVPDTGGWQSWTTLSATVTLTEGIQTLRLYALVGGFNVNWIQFDLKSTETSLATASFSRIFSPNNDGINDYWLWPEGEMYQNCSLKISTQLGEVVYETTSYQNDWDGTYNGRPLPAGAYYYLAVCNGQTITGAITIVR